MIVKADMTCIEKREFLHYAVDYVGENGEPAEHLVAVKFASNLVRGEVEDEATIVMTLDMADNFTLGKDYELQIIR